ncbi:AP-3 complex subunit delta [Aspergillus hancockii]|nr:AP-3 complex subunit delta [Aspergillus hancockii]
MNIIQTTTAMSLLYECINGIIQGGILDGDGGLEEKNEIASLCVGKLRGMVVTESDPNLKYVALLAFNRIVVSHPVLVSAHQGVIMDCLEDPDISIRLRALDLTARMVTSDTLQSVVNRLVNQLFTARSITNGIRAAGSFETDTRTNTEDIESQKGSDAHKTSTSLPDDYRIEVIHRILDICSNNNYSELPDFEWCEESETHGNCVAFRIGSELRNVAVRVRGVRMEATRAAESLVLVENKHGLSFVISNRSNDILGPLAWVVGEFAEHLAFPSQTLGALIDMSNMSLSARTLSLYIQAVPKVLAKLIGGSGGVWDALKISEISLLLARIIDFLDGLAAHPDLDVQERAIEFLEVMRLAADAVHSGTHELGQAPFLLSSMVPSLFHGLELNPVAVNAQKKVPFPEKLCLAQEFNNDLYGVFSNRVNWLPEPIPTNDLEYGNTTLKRREERKERNRDDPFYIGIEDESSGTSTPFHQALNASNGSVLDIDSIPIIDLKFNDEGSHHTSSRVPRENRQPGSRPKKYEIATDEMIGPEDTLHLDINDEPSKTRRSLLQVDSSGLEHLSLEGMGDSSTDPTVSIKTAGHDAEMAMAVQKVEKLRLEMQRASERVRPNGIPAEGTLVKKKRKVKRPARIGAPEARPLTPKDELLADDPQKELIPPTTPKKKKAKRKSNSG